eukprot:14432633-Ditylum_brightwellii.AAC.2
MIIAEEDICKVLIDEITLFLVSDGGAESSFSYFGWVFGTYMDFIIQHKGHAQGNQTLIESLRTESIGALSLLCFLVHFCKYHCIAMNINLWTHFCDNKTAVKRIQLSQKQTILTLSLTQCADYDAQAQIDAVLREMQLQENEIYAIEHVKGHQKGENLSHQAEQNNMADELGTQSRRALTWQQREQQPSILPASHIAVQINNKS